MKQKFTELDYQIEAIDKTIETITSEQDRKEFAIEMETGTGKTYTYIRTIFDAYKKLKISKFIIVAPGVAVREGIKQSFENLREHLQEKYPSVLYDVYSYSSKKLRDVDNFTNKETLQILIIGIHSFNKDTNILKQNRDGLSVGFFESEKYIDKMSSIHPVIVIDEPQMMDAAKSKEAIESLNPKFILKYSATHKNLKHDPVYILSPNDAYNKRLVKQIEYLGVYVKDGISAPIKLTKPSELKGKKLIGFILENGKERKIKDGDKIGNLMIERVLPNDILFDSGVKLSQMEFGETDEFTLRREQIAKTIEIHEQKKKRLKKQGIKVLSLFFIDSVPNFSKLRIIFEDELKKHYKTEDVSSKYGAYFSDKSTTKGIENDEEKLRAIIKDKEKLLSLEDEKVGKMEYVFTHSALGIGWDCPNIFQICFLRDIGSDISRRQFIGRGLRICINQSGERVRDSIDTPKDDIVNLLTVVASENWNDFVKNYQNDARKDGYEVPNPSNADDRLKAIKPLKLRKEKLSEAKLLWQKISRKSKYLIHFSERQRIYDDIANTIKRFEGEIKERKILTEKVRFNTAYNATLQDANYGTNLQTNYNQQEIIEKICEETWLTKWEVIRILQNCDESIIKKNPETWTSRAILEIKKTINDAIMAVGRVKIEYQLTNQDHWHEDAFFDEEKQTTANTLNAEKSLYELVEYDSEPERNFIKSADKLDQIKLFMKLPKGGEQKFHINTPIGRYYPDFAVVVENGGKLYMVFEVKDRASNELKSKEEEFKIRCAIEHFRALGFDVETKNLDSASELIALKNNSYTTVNSKDWN
jgi:type III restriction enzyme